MEKVKGEVNRGWEMATRPSQLKALQAFNVLKEALWKYD